MSKPNIRLLSTRPLPQELVQSALNRGVLIDCQSFIHTESSIGSEEKEIIKSWSIQPIAAVFTSMNAAEEVIAQFPLPPTNWDIYTMGGTTKTLLADFFGEGAIKGTGKDAASLAEAILTQPKKETVFFCGNIRRDVLPNILKEAQVPLTEVVVYTTQITPHLIDNTYDGICFFSPSAVDSFFGTNVVAETTILFAIGKATKDTIETYAPFHQIIVSELPDKTYLVSKAIDHFLVVSG